LINCVFLFGFASSSQTADIWLWSSALSSLDIVLEIRGGFDLAAPVILFGSCLSCDEEYDIAALLVWPFFKDVKLVTELLSAESLIPATSDFDRS